MTDRRLNPHGSGGETGERLPRSRGHCRAWRQLVTAGLGSLLFASVATADNPSPKAALSLTPVQPGVAYQQVEPEEVDACRVEDLDREGWSGWRVVAPDGTLLRRFADTNGDKRVDVWCYYEYGVEVYRDIDADFNGKADEYRWMGNGGTRWGLDDDEDGQIDSWKVISPEEVSFELVAALRDREADRFAPLLASSQELEQAGLQGEKLEELAEKSSQALRDFEDFAGSLEELGPRSEWMQFAGSLPGVVPEGSEGTTQDLTVYENAVVMYQDGDHSGQLLLGTLLRTDQGWRMLELPSTVGGGESIAQAAGNFFAPSIVNTPVETSAQGMDDAAQELVNQLESVDQKLSAASNEAELAELNATRADLLEKLIEAAEGNPQDRETWVRQLVDTVSMAVQSGSYPEGLPRLKKIADRYAPDDEALAAYADFQAIGSEYVVRQSPADADFAEVQDWYLESLSEFVDRYPETSEAGQAMLQLGLSKEFEDKEKEALGYYRKVAESFPNSDAGEMATGAVRRLESVGRQIELDGTTLDGQAFSLANLRGQPVVLHYWATWCEPCKQDMKLLRRLQSQHQQEKLAIVGVNLDLGRERPAAYLQEAEVSWTQLYEDGGLEGSPLAKRFGVQTLPTMMLIDRSGKVVEHNIRAAELTDALDQMLQEGASGGRRASR